MNQGAFSFYGVRRLAPFADLMFGGRVNTLQGNLRFNGPNQRSVDGSKTWFDPIVGVQLRTPDTGKRWHAQATRRSAASALILVHVADFPTVGVKISKAASIDFGYRWLDIDYSSGDNLTLFKWDVLTQGPVIGLRFTF